MLEYDVTDPEQDAVVETDVACRQIEGEFGVIKRRCPSAEAGIERRLRRVERPIGVVTATVREGDQRDDRDRTETCNRRRDRDPGTTELIAQEASGTLIEVMSGNSGAVAGTGGAVSASGIVSCASGAAMSL